MLYYRTKKSLGCGDKGRLFTTKEMRQMQLDCRNRDAFDRVQIPKEKTVVWCGIRTEFPSPTAESEQKGDNDLE